jgi:hypothetical protein
VREVEIKENNFYSFLMSDFRTAERGGLAKEEIRKRAMMTQGNGEAENKKPEPKNPENFSLDELLGIGKTFEVVYSGQMEKFTEIVWHIVNNWNNREWLLNLLSKYQLTWEAESENTPNGIFIKLPTVENKGLQVGGSKGEFSKEGGFSLVKYILLSFSGIKANDHISGFFNISTLNPNFKNISEVTKDRISGVRQARKNRLAEIAINTGDGRKKNNGKNKYR